MDRWQITETEGGEPKTARRSGRSSRAEGRADASDIARRELPPPHLARLELARGHEVGHRAEGRCHRSLRRGGGEGFEIAIQHARTAGRSRAGRGFVSIDQTPPFWM